MPSFHDQFVELFDGSFRRLYRYLNRLTGDPDLASDIAQDALVRLYRRGSLPDAPEAWLISVAMNRLRNAASTKRRRLRLLTPSRGDRAHADPPPGPDEVAEAGESRRQVRAALETLPERERLLLLLHAEGYGYRDIALALKLHPGSIGVFLARARRAFRAAYEEIFGAP
jgi:RNA polymerase sigma-70 factor (ECF subfamily)